MPLAVFYLGRKTVRQQPSTPSGIHIEENMKINITREWLADKLAKLDAAGIDEIPDIGLPGRVMVCKLTLNELAEHRFANQTEPMVKVVFGAVWEGSAEKQAASENAVFGHQTPQARFEATIRNQVVIDALVPGKRYYVTFNEAPD